MYDQQVSTQELSVKVTPLQRKTRTVDGYSCVYDLAVSNGMLPQYYLSLAHQDEQCVVCIGSSHALALLLFSALVGRLVTPCTLPDVLTELHCG